MQGADPPEERQISLDYKGSIRLAMSSRDRKCTCRGGFLERINHKEDNQR